MAMSFCNLSRFVTSPTTFTKSSSSSSSSSSPFFFTPSKANVRTVRFVTSATTPKPEAATTTTTTTTGKELKGIRKPRPISPAMQELLGVTEIPRTQALKQIWAYIKQHNLQDPENKKIIVCDEKLKKIFAGKDRVGFLEISGLLNPHFLK